MVGGGESETKTSQNLGRSDRSQRTINFAPLVEVYLERCGAHDRMRLLGLGKVCIFLR